MAYKYRSGKNYNNRADFLSDLWTQLEAMGWELHDDQSASNYKVYKSNGELGDRIYEYIKIDWNTADEIYFYAYCWWDATAHSGNCAANEYYNISTSESGFKGWIYGSKNLVAIMTKIGSSYYRVVFGHFDTKFLTVETDLIADATSGNDVTIEVSDTTGFKAGSYYQIFGSQGEGRDKVQVESVTDGTHLVITNLPRDYKVGAKIGQVPSTFVVSDGRYFYLTCPFYASGTNTSNIDTYFDLGYDMNMLIYEDFINPSLRDNFYYLQPLLGEEHYRSGSITGLAFTCYNQNYILQAPNGTYEDVFYVGVQDSGVAESGTDTTLVDNDKNWTSDSLIGKVIVITGGAGAGQIRKITDNDATSVTVDSWETNPDNTSQYVIADEAYRCLNNNTPYIVAREGT